MGIFALFETGKIKPKWTFTAKGAIWRILFSGNGMIVGEDRDEETKSLSFFFLDESTGRVVSHGAKYGDGWWSGIEAVDGNTVYIHGYASPDMPIHRGITAVDLFSGSVLWETPDVKFVRVEEGTIVAVREYFEKKVFYRLDPAQGTVLEETENMSGPGNGSGIVIDERRYRFPETLQWGDDGVSRIIREHLRPEELAGGVEYIEHDDMILFNYHKRNRKSTQDRMVLDNKFKIVSKANEKMIFSETLDTDAAYPVPDAFFFHDEMMFYVKNRSILTAIRL